MNAKVGKPCPEENRQDKSARPAGKRWGLTVLSAAIGLIVAATVLRLLLTRQPDEQAMPAIPLAPNAAEVLPPLPPLHPVRPSEPDTTGSVRIDTAGLARWTSAMQLPDPPDLSLMDVEAAELIHKAMRGIDALPDSAAPVGQLGRVYQALGHSQQAQACYARASELAPEAYGWVYHLAYVQEQNGEFEAAIAGFRKAFKLNPRYAPALEHLGGLLLGRGDLDGAEQAYRSYVKLHPKYPEGLSGLGKVALRRNQLAEAEKYLQQALQADRESADIHHALGQVYRKSGRPKKAAEHLARAQELRQERKMVYDPLLAEVNQAGTQMQKLRRRLDRALKARDVPLAETLLKQIVERQPDDHAWVNALAMLYAESGQYLRAISTARQAIRLNRSYLPAYSTLARSYLKLGRWPDVLWATEQALKLDNRSAEAHWHRGAVLVEMGRTDEGIAEFRETIKLDPSWAARAHLSWAEVLYQKEKLREAAQHYREVLKIEPHVKRAAEQLATIERRLTSQPAATTQEVSQHPDHRIQPRGEPLWGAPRTGA